MRNLLASRITRIPDEGRVIRGDAVPPPMIGSVLLARLFQVLLKVALRGLLRLPPLSCLLLGQHRVVRVLPIW
ncbi:hypothetical protein ACFSQQ_37735 [Mesorhizobium kowhaii]|uniref:hypothetical protein n=1 Tax=Mesorhizobium kowhaii TaxID=1300272 RepID=UPI0035EE9002